MGRRAPPRRAAAPLAAAALVCAALLAVALLPPLACAAGPAGSPPPPQQQLQRCSHPASVAAATEAVTAWARGARHHARPWYTNTLTRGVLFAQHRCACDTGRPARVSDFAVVVMAASVAVERAVLQREFWAGRAERGGATVVMIADAPYEGVNFTVLPPPAPGHGGNASDPGYTGAQHRSLRGLAYAVAAHPSARWYWMVDDDTYYDVEEAAAAVRYINADVPVVVGYVFRGLLRFRVGHSSSISGGAGMLLSAAAARAISAAMYTPACPFTGLNDMSLSRCAHALAIPLLHHDGFQPEFDSYSFAMDVMGRSSSSELGAAASTHRLMPTSFILAFLRDLLPAFKPEGGAAGGMYTPLRWSKAGE